MEIVNRGEVRRAYTLEARARVLTEATTSGACVLQVAQRYGISPSLVYRWRPEAAGRPARLAPPRAPHFVPLLINDGGLRSGAILPPDATVLQGSTGRTQ